MNKKSSFLGSVVKRLRHRPFAAVTRVRFPSESLIISADGAELAEQLICNQQVNGSSPFIGFIDPKGLRTFSSVGESNRLITGRSWVRVPEGPFNFIFWPSGSVG